MKYLAVCEHMMGDYEEVKVVEADSEEEVRGLLSDLGFFVYEIEEEPEED